MKNLNIIILILCVFAFSGCVTNGADLEKRSVHCKNAGTSPYSFSLPCEDKYRLSQEERVEKYSGKHLTKEQIDEYQKQKGFDTASAQQKMLKMRQRPTYRESLEILFENNQQPRNTAHIDGVHKIVNDARMHIAKCEEGAFNASINFQDCSERNIKCKRVLIDAYDNDNSNDVMERMQQVSMKQNTCLTEGM